MLDITKFKTALARLEELNTEKLNNAMLLEQRNVEVGALKDRPIMYEAAQKEIESIKNKIRDDYAEKKSLSEYISEHQSSVGREIIDYLSLLRDEANDYVTGSDKAFSRLEHTICEIKNYLDEINSLLPLIQHIHSGAALSSKEPAVNVFVPLLSLKNPQILSAEHEFSGYVLNNKKGYSLKSFFHDQAPHIKKVLEHYKHDYAATLAYLQENHGLCSGQPIGLKTFEVLCIEHFGHKKKTNLAILGWKANGPVI